MRKYLRGSGAAAAFVIVIGLLFWFMFNNEERALNSESRAYAGDTLMAITKHWDPGELWRRSTPHFRETTMRDDVQSVFSRAGAALGPLIEYRGATGLAMVSTMNSRTTISAEYIAKGSFQNGDADFQMSMAKVGDTWMIDVFHIRSQALMRNQVRLKS
jgi:hypothetical protein